MPPGDRETRGLRVRAGLVLPESELHVRRTRSSGPGGQHVNKVATRVELEFDVAASTVLSPQEKERVLAKLANRASSDGVLRIVAQSERSQSRNEAEARRRLAELLERALALPRRRRPTAPTHASRRERLDRKRRQARTKRDRRPPEAD